MNTLLTMFGGWVLGNTILGIILYWQKDRVIQRVQKYMMERTMDAMMPDEGLDPFEVNE